MTITLPVITAFSKLPANDDDPPWRLRVTQDMLAAGAPPVDGSIAPARPGQDRWPLREEFRAGRFGDDECGDRLWAAVKWIERLADIAHPLASSSALAAAQDNPPNAPGQPIHAIDKSRNIYALLPLEVKARAIRLLDRTASRLGSAWGIVCMAVFDRLDMRRIGEALGSRGKDTAPAAGRGALLLALNQLADARDILARMEEGEPDRQEILFNFEAANDNLSHSLKKHSA